MEKQSQGMEKLPPNVKLTKHVYWMLMGKKNSKDMQTTKVKWQTELKISIPENSWEKL